MRRLTTITLVACALLVTACGGERDKNTGTGSEARPSGLEQNPAGYVVGKPLRDGPQVQACLRLWNAEAALPGEPAGGPILDVLTVDEDPLFGDGSLYLADAGGGDCLLSYVGSHLDLSNDTSYRVRQWVIRKDETPEVGGATVMEEPEDVRNGLDLSYVDFEAEDGRLEVY